MVLITVVLWLMCGAFAMVDVFTPTVSPAIYAVIFGLIAIICTPSVLPKGTKNEHTED